VSQWYITPPSDVRVHARKWRGEKGTDVRGIVPDGSEVGNWRTVSDRAAKRARRGQYR
jgi:hypothetical protein